MFDQLDASIASPWKIYPNPSNGFLLIDMPLEFEQVEMKIYSLSGRCVFEKNFEGTNPMSLQLPLDSGIYIIEIKSGSTLRHTKLVVSR